MLELLFLFILFCFSSVLLLFLNRKRKKRNLFADRKAKQPNTCKAKSESKNSSHKTNDIEYCNSNTNQSEEQKKEKAGNEFETAVSSVLQSFQKSGTKTLQGLYFRWKNGTTTQTDNIFICKSGVYIIESKNYTGYVYGNDNIKNWVLAYDDSMEKSSVRFTFYNPIMQNCGHINYIASLLNNTSIPIHNVVVFSDKANLENIRNSSPAYVVHISELLRTIKEMDNLYQSNGIIFSEKQINDIFNKINSASIHTENIKEEHLQHVYNVKVREQISSNF